MTVLLQGAIVRGLYGVLALLSPRLLIAALPGMCDEEYHEDARYFNRLLGGRELFVAVATAAAARRGGAEREAVAANVICELTDSVALVAELRTRRRFDRMTVIGAVFNIAGHATWLRAAWAVRS